MKQWHTVEQEEGDKHQVGAVCFLDGELLLCHARCKGCGMLIGVAHEATIKLGEDCNFCQADEESKKNRWALVKGARL